MLILLSIHDSICDYLKENAIFQSIEKNLVSLE